MFAIFFISPVLRSIFENIVQCKYYEFFKVDNGWHEGIVYDCLWTAIHIFISWAIFYAINNWRPQFEINDNFSTNLRRPKFKRIEEINKKDNNKMKKTKLLDVRNSNATSFWIGLISDKFKLKFFVGKMKCISLRSTNFAAVSEAHFIFGFKSISSKTIIISSIFLHEKSKDKTGWALKI